MCASSSLFFINRGATNVANLIIAIKDRMLTMTTTHVAHYDGQLSLASVPDATTATQLGGEAQSTNRQPCDVSLLVSPKYLRPVG